MRKLVMSDIHGRYNAFRKVIEAAEINMNADKLYFLGDYIDRGEDSYEVIHDVREFERQGAVVLRGNHEDMHLLWLQKKLGNEHYKENGGGHTVRSFKKWLNDEEYNELIAWMGNLPYIHQDEEYIYVHAGIPPFTPSTEIDDVMNLEDRTWFDSIDEIPGYEMVWVRDDFLLLDKEYLLTLTDRKKVIHGHTAKKYVVDDGVRINIDTGAASKKALSLVDLTNRIVYSYNWQTEQVHIIPILLMNE